ncbi:MAG: type II toxin-antitoxin system VapC family toxin [Tepidiformaceae bacterium]
MSSERALYMDSSAIGKLLTVELETAALVEFLVPHRSIVSSALALVEVRRLALRLGPEAVRAAQRTIAGLHLLEIDRAILESAASLAPPFLRSLDAIHIASALSLGADLDALVTYDRRMRAAAESLGMAVAAPA